MSTAPAPRMIAIDIDGTLLPTRGKRISERNRKALRAAEAAGIEIVIATGRRQAFALPIMDPVGLSPNTILISSNGSITRNFAGELMERHLLPVETAKALCGLLRGYGSSVLTFDREGPGSLVIESWKSLHERIDLWVDANRASLIEVNPLERAFESGELPVQLMVCGTVEAMRRAEVALAGSRFSGAVEVHRTEYPDRDLCIVDILPQGCSKGAALSRLADKRGLTHHEVMAIGDNYNDLEMLEYAGRAVLMANSAPELLSRGESHGWEITATNDEDGIAQVIDSLLVSEPAWDVEVSGQA